MAKEKDPLRFFRTRAVSKSNIGSRFSDQLDATIETGKSVADSLTGKDRRVNHKIDKGDWSGDLNDLEGMSAAFSREEHTEDVTNAISDPENPGVVGDLMVSSLQGDYLAAQERAFRSRHLSPVRRRLHAAARRAGHGDDRGLFKRGVLGFIESILAQSKTRDYSNSE